MEIFDFKIIEFFHNFAKNTNFIFTRPFEFLTLITEKGFIYYIFALLLFFNGKKKEGVSLFCSLAISSLIVGVVLKNLFQRPRPFWETDKNYYFWWLQLNTFIESGFSFPSGHATLSSAFAFSLIFTLKKPSKYFLLLIPFSVGCARIYLLAHYPSDVFAGFSVGLFCSYFCKKLIQKLAENI